MSPISEDVPYLHDPYLYVPTLYVSLVNNGELSPVVGGHTNRVTSCLDITGR